MHQMSSAPARFHFIDALRGLAALSVALFHLYEVATDLFRTSHAWAPLHLLLRHGYTGVHVFFLISGFVMAHSLHGTAVTPGFFGRFLLRRSLRLDPVYWLALLTACGLLVFKFHVLGDHNKPVPPTWGQLAANVVYLQGLLNTRLLVKPSWTLCLEVQFYAALALLLGVSQLLSRTSWGRGRALLVAFLPVSLYSVALRFGAPGVPVPGLFLPHWYLFMTGVLVSWALRGTASARWLFGYAALVLLSLTAKFDVGLVVGLAAGGMVFLAGKLGRLHTWLASAPLLYLGRISYSFYLFHYVLGVVLARLLMLKLPGAVTASAAGAWAIVAVCLLLSLAAAHVVHALVEAPTLALSRRVRLKATKEPAGKTGRGVLVEEAPQAVASEPLAA